MRASSPYAHDAVVMPANYETLAAVCGRRAAESAEAAPRFVLFKERRKPHIKCLTDMPQGENRGIALPLFQTADVGTIHSHAFSQTSLSEAGSHPKPLH